MPGMHGHEQPAVYLLTNRPAGALYAGVTSDLPGRIRQHRQSLAGGFTARYNLTRLVCFELYEDMYQAITREKLMKAGSRAAKIRLIEQANPHWRDLYPDICR